MASPFKPRWFHFTLQGMLVIVALVAIGLAFLGTKIKRARDEQKIVQAILASGGQVQCTYFGMDARPGGPKETWFERLIDLDLETRASGVSFVGRPGQRITDADIQRLAGLEELASIEIRDAQVTGDAFAKLKGLQHVEYLSLDNSGLTDDGLPRIGDLPALEVLILRAEPGITDAGLDAFLRSSPKLHGLRIYSCPITGAGLKSLGDCPSVTYFAIDSVGDDDVGNIAGMRSLETLDINGNITDAALAEIGRLAALRDLRLNGREITDDGLRHLAGLQSLTNLTIGSARGAITDAGLEHLARLKHLKFLQLSSIANVSPEGIERLKRELPGITVR